MLIPLYAFLSSKKAFTPSHKGSLRLVFRCFRCEGFDFQVFTPKGRMMLLPPDNQRFPGVKAYSSNPSQVLAACVNTLFFKPSQSDPLKIRRKRTPCEGVNAFFFFYKGIHARERRQVLTITSKPYASSPASFGISLNWIIQIESAHTVGGLFFPTRRVKKNSSPLAHHNSPSCRTSATKGNQGLIVRAPEICTSCKEILQGRSQREKPATPPQHWATQP